MGYPMTYGRVINRNRLTGDYGAKMSARNTMPYTLQAGDFTQAPADFDFTEHLRGVIDDAHAEIDRLNTRWSLIVGDLRRLETDSQDEVATCGHIANRTGIDTEVVAAVLKGFFEW